MLQKEVFDAKFKNFEKAIKSLQKSLTFAQKNQDFEDFSILRDSNIQRFEYCFELSHKFMKYILEKYDNEIDIFTVRQVLKTAFKASYIQNLKTWFEMADFRNKTSHEYEEDVADDLFFNIPRFFEEIQFFYELIKKKYEQGDFTRD